MVTFADVTKALAKLQTVREAYLEANDWKRFTHKDGGERWRKTISWGTESTKRLEGDLLDAVRWQATHDASLEE